VELIFHLSRQAGFTVAMDQLDTEDFRSIRSIARLAARQRRPSTHCHELQPYTCELSILSWI